MYSVVPSNFRHAYKAERKLILLSCIYNFCGFVLALIPVECFCQLVSFSMPIIPLLPYCFYRCVFISMPITVITILFIALPLQCAYFQCLLPRYYPITLLLCRCVHVYFHRLFHCYYIITLYCFACACVLIFKHK